MKNTNLKLDKTKLVARLMIVILLLTSALTLASCGIFAYEWETYSHEGFVSKVNEYNSIHDIYVDTFISFDLDSNEEVSERIYYFRSGLKKKMHDKILYDIYNKSYDVAQVFYLNSDKYEHAFKITCKYGRIKNNITEEDKIEIKSLSKHFDCESGEMYYQASLEIDNREEANRIYEHIYRYEIYVNDVNIGCVHISCIEEATEEKLNEIIQMLSDSLVVLNTEKYFIWRDNK